MNVITSTHYNRPQATRAMLEHLSDCEGIEDYLLVCFCEPGFPEVLEEFKKYKHPIKVFVNERLAGCWDNKKRAITYGFTLSNEVIHLEDDVILAEDALKFFEFCKKYKQDETVFSCTALSLDPIGDIDEVSRKSHYESHAFMIFYRTWARLLADGWDGSDKFIRDNYTQDHIYPLVSRAKHLGELEGIGSTVEVVKTLRNLGHEPYAYAGLSNHEKLEFVRDKYEYINALRVQLLKCNNPSVADAISHQIEVAHKYEFDKQVVVNSKKEEWIKLNDTNVKSKAKSEYEKYKIKRWSNYFSTEDIKFKEINREIQNIRDFTTPVPRSYQNEECDVVICYTEEYEEYLRECLDSVLRSVGIKPIIHCVCFSHNPKYSDIYDDYYKRVNFYEAEKCGHYVAKMKVFPFLTTKYMATIDADDIMLPYRLMYSMHILKNGYDACCGKFQMFNCNKNPGKTDRIFNYTKDNMFYHSTSMVKTELFEEMGGWVDLPCASDFHFSNRVKSFRTYFSDDYFNMYRVHSLSISESQTVGDKCKIRNDCLDYIKNNPEQKGDLFKVQGGIKKV